MTNDEPQPRIPRPRGPQTRLPWQVQDEIVQAEDLMSESAWDKAVLLGGKLFLRRG
jgi:hypothetical protein